MKEDVKVLFLWKLLEFVKGEIWSWEDLLDETDDLSDRESEAWVVLPVVPDVTDMPVSPSCVVTGFCDGFSCCSDWDFVEPAVLFFLPKVCLLLYSYAGRDEV